HRVAAFTHGFSDKSVSFGDRTSRIVHKPRLDGIPSAGETVAVCHPERPNMKALDSLLPSVKDRLPSGPIPLVKHRALIFRPKPAAQVFASPPAGDHPCPSGKDYKHNEPPDYQILRRHHMTRRHITLQFPLMRTLATDSARMLSRAQAYRCFYAILLPGTVGTETRLSRSPSTHDEGDRG
ncbi:MAG TPA: hypothetical protein VNA86_08325, partial [bacterium]|nr:hypothetical protein [bacterium]